MSDIPRSAPGEDSLRGHITPVILTLNEKDNIARCLSRLGWAHDVVVVDSFSDDGTVELAGEFSNTRVLQRRFDRHADQWNFAIGQARSDWVMALDADYMIGLDLVQELAELTPGLGTAGYRARFTYACQGKDLRGSLYPPKIILFRRNAGTYWQNGHTQRLVLQGLEEWLRSRVTHDDRKGTARWLRNQWSYATLEAGTLRSPGGAKSALSRLRRLRFITPLLVPVYLLFFRGLILDGTAGLRYAAERMVAECLISLALSDVEVQPEAE